MTIELYAPGTAPGAKRKRSPNYLAYGWWQGKPVEKSFKTADPAEAQKQFYQFMAQLTGAPVQSAFSFADAVELYEQTRHVDKATSKRLAELKKEFGVGAAANITVPEIHRIAFKLFPKAMDSTRNREVVVPVAAVLHHAAEAKKIPWMRVRKLKEVEPPAKAVSQDVARALYQAAISQDQRALIAFLFSQGWRISEALRLTWAEIDFTSGSIARWNRKGNQWSWGPLAPAAAVELQELYNVRQVGRVFPWGNKSNVYRWLKPLGKKLGIHFTPHMARHSVATWAMNAGASPFDLMATFGWRDIKSVKRYGQISRKRALETLTMGLGNLGKK